MNDFPETPEDVRPTRIVVKFFDDFTPPEPPPGYSPVANVAALADDDSPWTTLRSHFEIVAIARYTTLSPEEIQAVVDAARENDDSYQAVNFNNYFVVTLAADSDAQSVCEELRGWDGVEEVEVEPRFTDAFPDGTNPRLGNEGFLDAAPAGIGARAAWAMPNGTGSGVKFIDIENGWIFNHEDYAAANVTLIRGKSAQPNRPHGTAAIGIVMMQDNDLGGVGIAPDCSARACGCTLADDTYDLLGAILAATNELSRGDVMLVEQQAIDGANPGPVEVSTPIFNAIKASVAKGIIVVEAGGNGGTDLDAYSHPTKGKIFNRGDAAFLDSGAILVGACSSASPHTRMGFSSFGSRIDCCAWGENVDTTTTDAAGATNQYTTSFNGTSSATPIIAGAAVIFQGMVRARALFSLRPSEVRAKLSHPKNGTATAAGARIGVMPDMKKIVKNEVEAIIVDEGLPSQVASAGAFGGRSAGATVIDPGHGGRAFAGGSSPVGVCGPRGTREKDVTFALALQVAARLGSGVALTRAGDTNPTLADRARLARDTGAKVFLSLHANSGPAGKRGGEIWLHDRAGAASRALALTLQRALAAEHGVKEADLAVLRPEAHVPDTAACLIEVDYLSDANGEARLGNASELGKLARAIAEAVREHGAKWVG